MAVVPVLLRKFVLLQNYTYSQLYIVDIIEKSQISSVTTFGHDPTSIGNTAVLDLASTMPKQTARKFIDIDWCFLYNTLFGPLTNMSEKEDRVHSAYTDVHALRY